MTLEKRFKKEFENGVEFWTSQDGTLLSIAVCFSTNWPKILRERVLSRNPRRRFKPSRVKIGYAYREWAEPEYFYFKGDKGKVWRIGKEKTPFQVYEYELESPI